MYVDYRKAPAMTRRAALVAAAAVFVYLKGTPVASAQASGLTLALDSVDVIVFNRRGRRIVVNIDEMLEAIAPTASPMFPPSPRQYPGGK